MLNYTIRLIPISLIILVFDSHSFKQERLRVPRYIYETLKNDALDEPEGISACEDAIQSLMQYVETDMGEGFMDLFAVKEQLDDVKRQANDFATRLSEHIIQIISKQVNLE